VLGVLAQLALGLAALALVRELALDPLSAILFAVAVDEGVAARAVERVALRLARPAIEVVRDGELDPAPARRHGQRAAVGHRAHGRILLSR
jgi:hypothetical protein